MSYLVEFVYVSDGVFSNFTCVNVIVGTLADYNLHMVFYVSWSLKSLFV